MVLLTAMLHQAEVYRIVKTLPIHCGVIMFVEEEVSKERYVMIPSLVNKTIADRIMQGFDVEYSFEREERGYYWYRVFGGDGR